MTGLDHDGAVRVECKRSQSCRGGPKKASFIGAFIDAWFRTLRVINPHLLSIKQSNNGKVKNILDLTGLTPENITVYASPSDVVQATLQSRRPSITFD